MKVHLVDFDDSFTLNVYAELRAQGLEVEIVPYREAREFLELQINTEHGLALALGPGPGHPDEYAELLPALKKILKRPSTFLLGICLGHQLLARTLGMEVVRSKHPLHGEVEEIALTKKQADLLGFSAEKILVQRYNSLAAAANPTNIKLAQELGVELICSRGDIYVMKGANFLTYQFHPESVGTSFRERFFRPIKAFLL